MDVKSAFLKAYLDKEVYVEEPPDYVRRNQEDKLYFGRKLYTGLSKLRELGT